MRCATLIVLFLLIAGLDSTVSAQSLTLRQREDLLSEALQSYDKGIEILGRDAVEARRRFDSSAQRLGQVIDDGTINGPILYNLANAHLQGGHLGEAIRAYRRAEQFIPGDPRLRSNLDYARSLCRSQIKPSGDRALTGALLSWHRRTSLTGRIILFAVAYGAFWMALLIRRFSLSTIWTWLAAITFLLWLLAGASAGADLLHLGETQSGVVTADEVTVRKGNGTGFAPQFEEPLYEGVEFDVLEHRPGWLHVQLPDGNRGWVEETAIGLIES